MSPAASPSPKGREQDSSALVLAAPDWNHLDTLGAGGELPPILWPVGGSHLAGLWMDHAVRTGCRRVVLYCPDRPAAVREELQGGAYWSLKLEVVPAPAPADAGAQPVRGLPCGEERVAPDSPGGLLKWWMDVNLEWLRARDGGSVQVDTQAEPGGWIGPRVTISPGAVLRPPYWVGAGSFVGPGCEIGPGALVGPGCLLLEDVRVRRAMILQGTFAGAHLELEEKILRGSALFDIRRGCRAELEDDFIASALKRPAQRVGWGERFLAALLFIAGRLLAAACGPAVRKRVLLPGGRDAVLATRSRGPLLARRADWLAAAAAGRLKLVGILPRSGLPHALPAETRALVENTLPGVFSLADVHGCHSDESPEELAHALYQAAIPSSDALVLKQLPRLAFLNPGP